MASLLSLKNFVASQMGKTDGATANSKRDILVNRSLDKFYNEAQWTWLDATKDFETTDFTSNVASLPTDYNKKYSPLKVWVYSGGVKYTYRPVVWDQVDSYPESTPVFAISKTQIKVNTLQYGDPSMLYTAKFTDYALDNTDNSEELLCPDIYLPGSFAIGSYWLSAERSSGKHQEFLDEYRKELPLAIADDKMSRATEQLDTYTYRNGYNGAIKVR